MTLRMFKALYLKTMLQLCDLNIKIMLIHKRHKLGLSAVDQLTDWEKAMLIAWLKCKD